MESASGAGGSLGAAGQTELKFRRESMTCISDLETIFVEVLAKDMGLNKLSKRGTVLEPEVKME